MELPFKACSNIYINYYFITHNPSELFVAFSLSFICCRTLLSV